MQTQSPIRIGFLCHGDVYDQSSMSGSPASAWKALSRHNVKLFHINAGLKKQDKHSSSFSYLKQPLAQKSLNLFNKISQKSQKILLRPFEYKIVLNNAIEEGIALTEVINRLELDVIVGVCVSRSIYNITTEVPIVHSSDATALLLNSTYPDRLNASQGHRRACEEIERGAMQKISAGVFPSLRTLESAIKDYGLPRDKGFLVPFGANVLPPENMVITPDPPTNKNLKLIVIASQPKRKRVDFCLEITEILVQKGIQATLNYIGSPDTKIIKSPLVNYLGKLRLSDEKDRRIHQQTLAESHFLLLPSIGEMYGIAPCEAAHFGRPSLVSDVGGLSTVVVNNETGFVMPLDAKAEDYANIIEQLCYQTQRYMEISNNARRRAVNELNWDSWSVKMMDIISQVIGQKSVTKVN
ncbi:MAG: D-inositol-3-phosphate glycosyltransferase [Chroococcopsis gigantea SAG 12.99]|jgi:starch synthase|nr:glycosyltransferase family 4 protein [Chlorogloea purpurea SAG 13.99]MDV2999414.1 D-inositol-3-phosphate glycosyltransferase [Chroococcopsis gigantea SAG 12.99]